MEVLIKFSIGVITGIAIIMAFVFRKQSKKKHEQLQIVTKKNMQNEQIIEQLKINYNKLEAEHNATKKLLVEYKLISKNINDFENVITEMKKMEDERFGRLIRILTKKGIQLTKEELNDLTP
jgi:MFS superfamily sulfate permease-like transporter